jgi:hypothetical protein
MKLKRIVVGVDGSANSVGAAEWAAGMAAATEAEVVAVHAFGLLERLQHDEAVPAQPHRDEIRQLFETTWCAPLDRAGVRSRRQVRDGSPVGVLLAVAEEENADLMSSAVEDWVATPNYNLGAPVPRSLSTPAVPSRSSRSGPSRLDHQALSKDMPQRDDHRSEQRAHPNGGCDPRVFACALPAS